MTDIKTMVNEALDTIEALYKEGGLVTGLRTGFEQFDNLTRGLQPRSLNVIAGFPSMGKTALAMNIAEHVAIDQGVPVAIFSLDIPSDHLVPQLLCSRARVNFQNLVNGFLGKKDSEKLSTAAIELSQSKLHIDDISGVSVEDLRKRAHQLKDHYGIGLIIIDNCQSIGRPWLVDPRDRLAEMESTARGIKALAKELRIPIVVLTRLRHEAVGQNDSQSRISDLKELGPIEQIADVVGRLSRSAYFAKDEDEKAEMGGDSELLIAKNTYGQTGVIPLAFKSEFWRFESRSV